MNDATQPSVARGDLAKTPFAHLVLYLYQRRSSGTLIIDAAGSSARVLFHRGRAVAAHVTQPATALDEGLLALCALSEGPFEFHDSDLVGSGPAILTGMFDPFAFVAEAARRYAHTDHVQGVLAQFGPTPLCLQPAMDPTRLSLTPSEAQFVELLSSANPVTIDGLCAQSPLELEAAQRLLYVLLITKILGPAGSDSSATSAVRQGTSSAGTPGSQPGTSMRSGPRTPAERSRSSGAAWRAIAMRAGEMSTNSPTPAARASSESGSHPAERPLSRPLTPPPTQSVEAPRRPPSRPLSRPLTPPPTQSVEAPRRPPSRPLTPPQATPVAQPPRRPPSRPLTPPPREFSQSPAGAQPRVRPPSRPLTPPPFGSAAGSDAPRTTTPSSPVSRVTPRPSPTPVEMLDAPGKLRRVEQLCQRHAYDEALPIIRDLIESDRKNATYLGVLSHVLLGRTTDNTIGKEIVETVNQALRIDPDQIQALYTKARCYKRMGKDREALHYFRRTAAVDPQHIDATREVRLLLLRMSEKKKEKR